MILLWIILGLVLALILWLVFVYNSLIALRTRKEEAWSDIEVQLKRRYDLIPNLVEAVKGYASHEKELFEKVTEARSKAMGAQGPDETIKAEGELTRTLKTLFAVAENYPQLRASENFQKLQDELRDTEDKIQASRRFYNTNVRDLNIRVQTFPSNIVASIFGFKKAKLFELEQEEIASAKKPPKIDFNEDKK